MIRREGEVIGTDAAGSLIRFDRSDECGTCRGCGLGRGSSLARLPGALDGAVSVSLRVPTLIRILCNSLLAPLAGFVTFAIAAAAIGADDMATMLASIAGFSIGLALCRRQPIDSLQIQEVHHD